MSLLWSGPARALQAHCDLFASVQQTINDWDNGNPVLRSDRVFAQIASRANLLTSIGVPGADGISGAKSKDRPHLAMTQDNLAQTRGCLSAEYDALNTGDTYYVSHHVGETVSQAAALAEPEPLFATDLPSPTGLIVLEYPLLLPDLHPDTGELLPEVTMPVRMIGWQTGEVGTRDHPDEPFRPGQGVRLTLYADRESFVSIYVASLRSVLPEHAEDFDTNTAVLRLLDTWLIDVSGWAFGIPWREGSDVHEEGTIITGMAWLRRWFLSLMRWLWQRVLTPERYTPTRHERRRADRKGWTIPEDGYIKVLRLRREVEREKRGEAPEGDAAFHSWVTRGHWRRQWYRSLGPARTEDGSFNHDSHRLVWIASYVAGHGPLVVGHNVSAAVR